MGPMNSAARQHRITHRKNEEYCFVISDSFFRIVIAPPSLGRPAYFFSFSRISARLAFVLRSQITVSTSPKTVTAKR